MEDTVLFVFVAELFVFCPPILLPLSAVFFPASEEALCCEPEEPPPLCVEQEAKAAKLAERLSAKAIVLKNFVLIFFKLLISFFGFGH
jgi:hypothetical protein